MTTPENTAANAEYHGILAAGAQFDLLRVILDTLDDDDSRTLTQDAAANYVVAFKRSMRQRVNEYLDSRAAWGAYLDSHARA